MGAFSPPRDRRAAQAPVFRAFTKLHDRQAHPVPCLQAWKTCQRHLPACLNGRTHDETFTIGSPSETRSHALRGNACGAALRREFSCETELVSQPDATQSVGK